jgi:hypothetical protein
MKALTMVVVLACLASGYAWAQEAQPAKAPSMTASLNK